MKKRTNKHPGAAQRSERILWVSPLSQALVPAAADTALTERGTGMGGTAAVCKRYGNRIAIKTPAVIPRLAKQAPVRTAIKLRSVGPQSSSETSRERRTRSPDPDYSHNAKAEFGHSDRDFALFSCTSFFVTVHAAPFFLRFFCHSSWPGKYSCPCTSCSSCVASTLTSPSSPVGAGAAATAAAAPVEAAVGALSRRSCRPRRLRDRSAHAPQLESHRANRGSQSCRYATAVRSFPPGCEKSGLEDRRIFSIARATRGHRRRRSAADNPNRASW